MAGCAEDKMIMVWRRTVPIGLPVFAACHTTKRFSALEMCTNMTNLT